MYVKNTDKIPDDRELRLSAPAKDDSGFYTWEKKIEVATKYMALGNMRLVSELCKVDYRLLMAWKKEEWWHQLIDEIRKANKSALNTKLSKIVDRSLEVISDRIENGDFILNNKTGEVERKPVSLRDANAVTKDLLNHQIKVEELEAKIEIQKETVQDQLALLAKEFSKWSKSISNKKATDIDFKEINDALHEGRQEGLPA
jgi:hypothetical protein